MNPSKPRAGAKLLSVKAITEEFGLPRNFLYERIAAGKIPHVRLPDSSRVLVKRSDVEALIESWTVRR